MDCLELGILTHSILDEQEQPISVDELLDILSERRATRDRDFVDYVLRRGTEAGFWHIENNGYFLNFVDDPEAAVERFVQNLNEGFMIEVDEGFWDEEILSGIDEDSGEE